METRPIKKRLWALFTKGKLSVLKTTSNAIIFPYLPIKVFPQHHPWVWRKPVLLVVPAVLHLAGNLRCLAVHIIERGTEWQVRMMMRKLLPKSGGMCRDPALHRRAPVTDLLQPRTQQHDGSAFRCSKHHVTLVRPTAASLCYFCYCELTSSFWALYYTF